MNLACLLTLLAALLVKYWPEQLDPSLKPKDSSELLSEGKDLYFDFIVVGAGSAGCVVANRLSANPDWRVLLIEAGGPESYFSDTPGLTPALINTKYDWNFTTTKQRFACLNNDGICYFSSGHVMGGSSTVNGMVYVRGNPEDYDEWEEMGNSGWNYKEVLPYFRKAENTTIPELMDSPYHSTSGPLSVGYPNYKFPMNQDYIEAGKQYGLDVVDYNGETQFGVGYIQSTIRDGVTRCSSSKAYLNPIRNRGNLRIFMNTIATKVLFDEKLPRRAIGVEYISGGVQRTVFARKEVVLSAGNIGTAKLLLLSGVGPREHLEDLEIPVIADLPVGKHCTDHVNVFLTYKINIPICCGEFTKKTVEQYARDKKGPLTTYLYQIQVFINGRPNNFNSTVGWHIGVESLNNTADDGVKLQILSIMYTPKSNGHLRLKSKYYLDEPLIDPNYLFVKSDLIATIWGIREAQKFMSMPALAKYSPKWVVDDTPECEQYFSDPVTDQFIECYIKYQGRTQSVHSIGTARMGNCSSTSVVDSKLKVHGFENIRVIDASVMPKIVRANTNAPTIMIGEKGSDCIITSHQRY